MGLQIQDYAKLCIHTVTTRPWSIEEDIAGYAAAGVKGITLWWDDVKHVEPETAGSEILDAGMEIVSLFHRADLPAYEESGRQEAIARNIEMIEYACACGAPLIVLACGSVPGQPLAKSRKQIEKGLAAMLRSAEENKIRLAIEPFHPMFADTFSAIVTLKQANDLCDDLCSDWLGVAVDAFHLWWDPHLEMEIERSGRAGRLFSFHIADWVLPGVDPRRERGIMGERGIPLRKIRACMEQNGFQGFHEVEVWGPDRAPADVQPFLDDLLEAYLKAC